MSENADAREIYLNAYKALERGDYRISSELADACLEVSHPTSYWHAGALGLKCWLANFNSDLDELDQIAETLLALDTGSDKPWFVGLALLNLGLKKHKTGYDIEVRGLFLRAAECYHMQQLHPGQPSEWQKVIEYFCTLCRWAAAKGNAKKKEILDRFGASIGREGELLLQLATAIQLMMRYTEGENVKQKALESVSEGVSGTFLAAILLEDTK
jgi:hypothetical protein